MTTATTETATQTAETATKPAVPKLLRKVDSTPKAEPTKKAPARQSKADRQARTVNTDRKAKATKKAAEKKAEPKPKAPAKSPVTTRKGVAGQVCLGSCGKWKPLDDFPRKSAARGGGPLRRCKSCITAERKAAKAAAEKPEGK